MPDDLHGRIRLLLSAHEDVAAIATLLSCRFGEVLQVKIAMAIESEAALDAAESRQQENPRETRNPTPEEIRQRAEPFQVSEWVANVHRHKGGRVGATNRRVADRDAVRVERPPAPREHGYSIDDEIEWYDDTKEYDE